MKKRVAVAELRNGQPLATWSLFSDIRRNVTTRSSKASPRSGLLDYIAAVFLPTGYPASVPSDYIVFFWWDLLQALTSYTRGILTSHATFKGLGVGSEAATPLAAVFQVVIRDNVGLWGGTLFASVASEGFDACAKQWRLFADVVHDLGMAIELSSQYVPQYFLLMASLGQVARTVSGVAGQGTRMALTQHFARGRNAADVFTKDQNRERFANMLGMVLGMAITRAVEGNALMSWSLFLVLTVLHIIANWVAMRSLVLPSINKPRLQTILKRYLAEGTVLTPLEMSRVEPLSPPFLPYLWHIMFRSRPLPVQFGIPLSKLRGSDKDTLQAVAEGLQRQGHAVLLLRGRPVVVLGHEQSAEECLRAYTHALLLAARIAGVTQVDDSIWMRTGYPVMLTRMQEAGWDVEMLSLPRAVYTVQLQDD